MSFPPADEFMGVLAGLSRGEKEAVDRLVPVLYDELRRVAAAELRREGKAHTLQPTALVHEVYLKLVGQRRVDLTNRAHFLAWAARMMRQVLISHARRRRAKKRGGKRGGVPLDSVLIAFEENSLDVLALQEALEKLERIDERKRSIVELRFFGGLTIPEVSEVLCLSHATVEREWRFARAWLFHEIAGRAR